MTVLRLADGGYIGRFAIFDKGYTIDGAPIRFDRLPVSCLLTAAAISSLDVKHRCSRVGSQIEFG